VYRVAETSLLPLSLHFARPENLSPAEVRYRGLLGHADLTDRVFFSHAYALAASLQENETGVLGAPPPPADAAPGAGEAAAAPASTSDYFEHRFVWNSFLTRALRSRLADGGGRWCLPLVHGFFEQRRLSVFGRPLTLTLLARRSRHYAGTRYRKRGLSEAGHVANEVEVETIVEGGRDWRSGAPLRASSVQHRGSIPLFWRQEFTSLSPKASVIVHQYDPVYDVTGVHFEARPPARALGP